MDPEGCQIIRRPKRSSSSSKMAVLLLLQNLMVASCLLTTFYFCYFREQPSLEHVYIQFEGQSVLCENGSLKLSVSQSHQVELKNKTEIHILHTSPYVWHMDLCFAGMGSGRYEGRLSLREQMHNLTLSAFPLSASTADAPVCRRLQSVVYLREGEVASVALELTKSFRVVNMTMGLHGLPGVS